MLRDSVTIEEALELLNGMIALDGDAVNRLVSSRVECNEGLANHPTVQCSSVRLEGRYTVGLLGVINGLFGIDESGYGAIVAITDSDTGRLIEFKRSAIDSVGR